MKTKLLLITIIVILTSCCIYSQSGWYMQDSSGTSFLDVFYANVNTGFAVGYNGILRKTTNGGNTWFTVSTGTIQYLRSMYMVNALTGFISGNGNTIIKTINGGSNWQFVNIPNIDNNVIYSIRMLNNNTGYAVGRQTTPGLTNILKTTDSGNNWTTSYSQPNGIYYAILCADENNILAAGTVITRTTNGGLNWVGSTVPITTIKSIGAINTSKFYGTGDYFRLSSNEPSIILSTNSGGTWAVHNFIVPNFENFEKIHFFDEDNGIVIGKTGISGISFRTTNSGKTWIRQNINSRDLYGVYMITSQNITAVGGGGTIYNTTNGGWGVPIATSLLSPSNGSLSVSLTLHFRWNKIEYDAAVYRIQVSTDPAFNSTNIDVGMLDTTGYITQSGALTNNNTYYWRVRSENPAFNSQWSSVWSFNTNLPANPNLISPSNNDTGIIPATILDWSDVNSILGYRCQIAEDEQFQNIVIDSINIAQSSITPLYGKLQHSKNYFWRANAKNNSGEGQWSLPWKFTTSSKVSQLIFPANGDTGVVGRPIFDWSDYSSASSYRIQVSTNPNFTSFIINTSGINQSQYQPGSNLGGNIQYYWRVNAIYSGGTSFWSDVKQFKTSVLTNLHQISENIPTVHKLYKNYPNPFNPITKIKFDVPANVKGQTSNVKLVIYDIVGREITTLVNSELKPGTYEADWDASSFSSGVYFYKIISGDFIETKKMVLMK